MTEDDVAAIDRHVEAVMDEAVEFAEDEPAARIVAEFLGPTAVAAHHDARRCQIKYRDALRLALTEEMARDPLVFVMGEGIAERGGSFKVTEGLLAQFGAGRVIDTPLSEAGFTGMGAGAAIAGARPVVEILFIDFLLQAMDQVVNQAAKYRFMSGGQGTRAARHPDPGRRRRVAGGPALPEPRGDVLSRARAPGRDALDALRRQGAAEVGHPERRSR